MCAVEAKRKYYLSALEGGGGRPSPPTGRFGSWHNVAACIPLM